MMVSGIPTASGYEERIRFSELEVVDAGAIDHGVLSTLPEGHYMNGWDVNVAGVRTTMVKRNIRYHRHAVSPGIQCLVDWVLMEELGIYLTGQEKGGTGVLYRKTVRGFPSTLQAIADGVTGQDPPSDAEEEQAKLYGLEFVKRGHGEQ
jgi:hypothetical protein